MAGAGEVGGLRHRITFEKQVRVADGAGGWTETWATERSSWAKVVPLGGGERWRAMQTEHPVSHRITVRYNATVAGYHRDG
ncbi:MAG: phage head closure protein, partial [Kiloniellales bacterium]